MGVNFNKMRSYQAFVEFPFACGIQVGTQVRVRGVKVGNVLSVRPNLERVEVLVEMDDDGQIKKIDWSDKRCHGAPLTICRP